MLLPVSKQGQKRLCKSTLLIHLHTDTLFPVSLYLLLSCSYFSLPLACPLPQEDRIITTKQGKGKKTDANACVFVIARCVFFFPLSSLLLASLVSTQCTGLSASTIGASHVRLAEHRISHYYLPHYHPLRCYTDARRCPLTPPQQLLHSHVRSAASTAAATALSRPPAFSLLCCPTQQPLRQTLRKQQP